VVKVAEKEEKEHESVSIMSQNMRDPCCNRGEEGSENSAN